jgi:hypothetical protein
VPPLPVQPVTLLPAPVLLAPPSRIQASMVPCSRLGLQDGRPTSSWSRATAMTGSRAVRPRWPPPGWRWRGSQQCGFARQHVRLATAMHSSDTASRPCSGCRAGRPAVSPAMHSSRVTPVLWVSCRAAGCGTGLGVVPGGRLCHRQRGAQCAMSGL